MDSLIAYQRAACKTAIYPGAGDPESMDGLSYVTMGLVGEAGEIANKVKKILRDGNGKIASEHRSALMAELGDVLWYTAMLAQQLGNSLDVIATANINKLLNRQARGVLGGSGDQR